ncbi:hypothetical protein QE152_g5458 [Popillia japonica]|uniref:Uncharacterized protein n=1 Tax=Popillia japonica TaxID=7064 RepID=A0AAW1ML47_POPJA
MLKNTSDLDITRPPLDILLRALFRRVAFDTKPPLMLAVSQPSSHLVSTCCTMREMKWKMGGIIVRGNSNTKSDTGCKRGIVSISYTYHVMSPLGYDEFRAKVACRVRPR